MYAVANSIAVRRLASETYQDEDINLVRLLDMGIRDSPKLWKPLEEYHHDEATRARAEVLAKEGTFPPGWEISACKKLIGEDRKELINAAKKANQFASKRAAHNAPGVEVATTFFDLDEAIDTVVKLTEKYTRLTFAIERQKNVSLSDEMKRRKLETGWDAIFLEAWATTETLSLELGDMVPPRREG
ncbi:MAG: hypothetical protein ACRD37_05810 [Candidatus Acidiferrales bacterium]